MEILKWVWRASFLLTAGLYVSPMLYMQYAFSAGDLSAYAIADLLSLITTPLLIYIPVEVFFHLHKVSTSE